MKLLLRETVRPGDAGIEAQTYRAALLSLLVGVRVFAGEVTINAFVIGAGRVSQADRADVSPKGFVSCAAFFLTQLGSPLRCPSSEILQGYLFSGLAITPSDVIERLVRSSEISKVKVLLIDGNLWAHSITDCHMRLSMEPRRE